MKDALGNEIKRGDRLVASDAYKKHMMENYPAGSCEIEENFVVDRVKEGPFWDKNGGGYHIGGWKESSAYGKDGSNYQSWEVQKVTSDNSVTEPKKKKGWW